MSSCGVMCDICGYVLCNRDGLTRHKTNMHGRKKVLENRTRCQECNLTLYKIDRLRSHLLTVHNMEMDFEIRAFLTLEDFYMWKVSYERQNNCSYVLKKKNCSQSDFLYLYDCSRSGIYKDKKIVAKRSFKSQGTKKIGLNCTSTIKVTMLVGIYCVRFCKTHYGHATEIEHCNISLIDKQQIVDMLLEGLTVDQVLEKYKCSEEVERMHLLKRKDVKNIAATYNISVENKLKQKKPPNNEQEEIEQIAEGEEAVITEEFGEMAGAAETEELGEIAEELGEMAEAAEAEELGEMAEAAEAEELGEMAEAAETEELEEIAEAAEIEELGEMAEAVEAEELGEMAEALEAEELGEMAEAAEMEELREMGENAEAEEIVETQNVIIITEDGTTHTYCRLEDFPEHTVITPEFFITNLT